MKYIKYNDFIDKCGIMTPNISIVQLENEIKSLSFPKEEVEIAKYLKWDFELFQCCEIAIEHREKIKDTFFQCWYII